MMRGEYKIIPVQTLHMTSCKYLYFHFTYLHLRCIKRVLWWVKESLYSFSVMSFLEHNKFYLWNDVSLWYVLCSTTKTGEPISIKFGIWGYFGYICRDFFFILQVIRNLGIEDWSNFAQLQILKTICLLFFFFLEN